MSSRISQVLKVVTLTCLLGLTCGTSRPTGTTGENAAAGNYPEVRLRKLHLVRPDLIPYPIAYDVYC